MHVAILHTCAARFSPGISDPRISTYYSLTFLLTKCSITIGIYQSYKARPFGVYTCIHRNRTLFFSLALKKTNGIPVVVTSVCDPLDLTSNCDQNGNKDTNQISSAMRVYQPAFECSIVTLSRWWPSAVLKSVEIFCFALSTLFTFSILHRFPLVF